MITPEEYNKEIKNWGSYSRTLMLGQIKALNINGKKELLRTLKSEASRSNLQKRIKEEGILSENLKARYAMNFGEIERIGYSFPKQGVFSAFGVSRGHGRSNPRKQKNWFESVLDRRVPTLADIVLEMRADMAIESTYLKNNGHE